MKRTFTLKFVFFILLAAYNFAAKAQNLEEDTVKRDSTIIQSVKPRTVFLEVGGPGLALTVNYDTRFKNTRDKWGYTAGIGYYNTGSNSVFSIPLQVNYLWGFGQSGGDSFMEFGGGTTFVYSKGSTNGTYFQFDNVTGFIGTATIGYRFQQDNGGINFRISFVPILYDEGLIAAGGFSIGYTF